MSNMGYTIADAILHSNCQFTFCYLPSTMNSMSNTSDPHVEKLRILVTRAGGPTKFAHDFSQDSADKPIDPTYVSQILNGHRAFRDIARRNMAARAGLPSDYFEVAPEINQLGAVYNLWPAIVSQIAEIARDLPEPMQNQLLGQAKMLQSECRVTQTNPALRAGQ